MKFEEKIRTLRKEHGYSQEELAFKMNVSRQAISKWELGTIPDVENLIKLSNIFGCSLDYLLKEDYEVLEIDTSKRKKRDVSFYTMIVEAIVLVAILVLWILSKTMDWSIVQFNTNTNSYYVGFAGFIKYYGLEVLVYILLGIWICCIVLNAIYTLNVTKKEQNEELSKHNKLMYLGLLIGLGIGTFVVGHDMLCSGAAWISRLGFLGIVIYIVVIGLLEFQFRKE